MDIQKIVLEAAEDILGLEQEDMFDNMDMDLWEEGLLDSIGMASLLASIEERIGRKIDIKEMTEAEVISFHTIIEVVERVAAQK